MKLSSREEDYLETIYRLSQTIDSVGISDVAHERSVTLPTVKSAVRRLKEHGLVSQRHYGKIVLNASGRKRAEEIYRVHRAIRIFLTEILLLPPELSEREACRMEHGMDKKTLTRLVDLTELIRNCPDKQKGCLRKYKALNRRKTTQETTV
jgi:DtxR family transcriptional regulator, Mn-dependent transcriptional regulator